MRARDIGRRLRAAERRREAALRTLALRRVVRSHRGAGRWCVGTYTDRDGHTQDGV